MNVCNERSRDVTNRNESKGIADWIRMRMKWPWVCCLIVFLGLSMALTARAEEGAGKASADAVPATAQGNHFNIFEYAVEGNTLLSTIAIEQAVYPLSGREPKHCRCAVRSGKSGTGLS